MLNYRERMTSGVTDLPERTVDKLFGRHRKTKLVVEESIQKTGLKFTLHSDVDPRFLRYIAYPEGSDYIDIGLVIFFDHDEYWNGIKTGTVMSYGNYRDECIFIEEEDGHLAGEYLLQQLNKFYKQPLDSFYAKYKDGANKVSANNT